MQKVRAIGIKAANRRHIGAPFFDTKSIFTALIPILSICTKDYHQYEKRDGKADFQLAFIYQLIDILFMESKREELLRNATETVRKSGSAAVNFRDLGQSVGVKSSSVHYYFPTKSDLLEEIARRYRTSFIQELDRGIQNSKSFKQDLLVLVQLFEGARSENLSCLCGMLATEAELLDPKVKSATNDFFSALQGWVTRQAKQRNAARPAGLQPSKFSLLLISLLEGALLLSRLETHRSSLGAVDEWIRKLE